MNARVADRKPRSAAFRAGLVVLAAVVGCSLGLDESLIDKARDGDIPLVDAALPDPPPRGGEAVDAPDPVGGACTSDDACAIKHGCLKGRCDLTRKRCTYDVCRPSACSAAVCDPIARQCEMPAPYKYQAAQFDVGAQISCRNCAAAVHPWLFLVTSTGAVAFNVSNPANPRPAQVPIVGLGFVPGALVQSGSRVWMLGGASGGGPSRIQIAYVDVPSDPFATRITAHTVLAMYNRPAERTLLFGRGGDSALLVGNVPEFPSATIEPPLNEPVALSATPVVAQPSFGPSAVSGRRLLMSAVNNAEARFALVDDAGTQNPTMGPVVTLTDAGSVSEQRTFAQSVDGAIFWATGVLHTGVGAPATRAARGHFLVPNEAGAIELNAGVDLELYDVQRVGPDAAIFGPNQATAALLDSKTAMVAVQARESEHSTAVQFVTREPLEIIKEPNSAAPRRQVLPVPIGAIAAATASNGIGYLVANDAGTVSATVYVFDPACAP